MDKNSNNPFRRKDGNQGISKKESEWGKVKFNPVSKVAHAEQATPWSHFKNDLIKQQQDELRMKNDANSQEIVRKREENYRRNLITSKRSEPTQWEDFSEETVPESSSRTKDKNNGIFQNIPSNIKNIHLIKKEDFDSRLLTKDQNNFLKKIITRNACTIKGRTFKDAVKDWKLNGGVSNKSKEIKSIHRKKKK